MKRKRNAVLDRPDGVFEKSPVHRSHDDQAYTDVCISPLLMLLM